LPFQPIDRRTFLAASVVSAAIPGRTSAQTPTSGSYPGGILGIGHDGALSLYDPTSGSVLNTFAINGKPLATWAATAPGLALVQSVQSLAVVSALDGSSKVISLPDSVAGTILPASIQFRGSTGVNMMLIGTPDSGANTFLIDLSTGERTAVIGLLDATTPPAQLQNVAVSSEDATLLVWDGRTTWIVDLASRTTRTLGSVAFTFSAGFTPDGAQIVYSQQLEDSSTELHMQSADGSNDVLLFASKDILVALPIPGTSLLLLDDRTTDGGSLSLFDPDSKDRIDALSYNGATSIVQFTPDGSAALIGIEGGAGRDWYSLTLAGDEPGVTLLKELADAAVTPGFALDSDWAIAVRTVSDAVDGSVLAVNLKTTETIPMIEAITADAAVSNPMVAADGPGGMITIDSFSEYAVHFLDFEKGEDRSIDLMKGGTGILAPDGTHFAVIHDLNTGGNATVIYDADGTEGVTMPVNALAWI
jgi:hypothetical protein